MSRQAMVEALRADPQRTAILTDVDGTLAPIVERPEQAKVPPQAREVLERLSERYGLVACISGRQAQEARRLVGVEALVYAGNHGLELLLPGDEAPRLDPALGERERERDAAAFVAGLDGSALEKTGLRLEDKGPIQALHWRGARDEDAAAVRAEEIGRAAEGAGLATRHGRKVLELRPRAGGGKEAAVAALLGPTLHSASNSDAECSVAVYAGDDRTDLDAFRRLRELREEGRLETAVCVGIASAEGPSELAEEADLIVHGPECWLAFLKSLAR